MNNVRFWITSLTTATVIVLAVWETASAQQISTSVELTVTNNGSPQAMRTLKFGVSPSAGLGIDPELGEDAFPPFPPSAVFEARFVSNSGSELGEGSPVDIRPFTSMDQADAYKIKFQAGTNGLPVTISWDQDYLRDHYSSVTMKDPFGGVILSVDMLTTGSAVIANENLTEVIIEAEGPTDPNLSVDDTRVVADAQFNLRQIVSSATGTVTVAFTLGRSAEVTMTLTNIEGRVISRIVDNAVREGGVHYERLDVGALSAGAYFVLMEADGVIDAQPLVVLR